ncbi:M23 family metallopeptidase [Dehalobacter sp. DCM]|uniref:M23 family metallopeptidase n=1 Tax=Dehalobacter sp. DCM TaxID=2907827 RepID=UPI00308142BC|nr:M23 family metallopeptidase [Dehalobacter sp. DCM]
MNDMIKAKDYAKLASISPDLIIECQKKSPNNWQDYVAVTVGIQRTDNTNEKTNKKVREALYQQLDNGIDFKVLNWTSIDKGIKKNAQNCYKLLERYPFYTPGKYLFPIKIKSYYSDTYGAAREGGNRQHEGTDIFNEKGTPIFCVCDGFVEKSGWNRLGGERVGIRGKDGNYYYYAHLDKINEKLAVGDPIKMGDLIGTMGNTGDALTTPDHLHFGIELPNGKWVNPYAWLKVWEHNSDSTIVFNVVNKS